MADPARPARFDRIYDALKVLLVQETFTLPQMKERLPDEVPGYVTQLVHQLEREGHLRDSDGVYSWTCELSDFPAHFWVEAQVHGTQLVWTPEEDRPRERLLARGAASLRTAELLAILIRSGRKGESGSVARPEVLRRAWMQSLALRTPFGVPQGVPQEDRRPLERAAPLPGGCRAR